MGLFGRLLGQHEAVGGEPTRLEANEALADAPSLQVLLGGPLTVDEHGLSRALHAYDAQMRGARVQLTQDFSGQALLGLVGWGRHVVRLVGFNFPVPPVEAEWGYASAHLSREGEARARAHGSHVVLVYAGLETDVHEQHVALAAVAGALVVSSRALLVLDEAAHVALSARLLASEGKGALEHLRAMPLFAPGTDAAALRALH